MNNPSREAYGLLCAWWMTLYLALLLRTSWAALLVFLGFMSIALLIDAGLGTSWLYHDAPSALSGQFVLLLFMLWLLWASPVVLNKLVLWMRSRVDSEPG